MKVRLKSRKRRGLSSVVGALFFIVLMIGTFTALLAAFSYQNDLIDTQRTVTDRGVAKLRENFFVTAKIEPDNELFVTVKNRGTNPVEIANLWVIEKNTPGKLATQYDVGYKNSAVPIASSKNITSDTIVLVPSTDYTVKVVSRLGTVVTVDVPDTTITSGPAGPPGQQGLSCWDVDGNGVGTPANPDEDINNDTLYNYLDCQGGLGDTNVLEQNLLNKPEIFMIFPSPYGYVTHTQTGAWGVNVANPSVKNMDVNKIVITTIPAITQSGETIFPSSCSLGSWTCQGNQMIWHGATAVTIAPKSVKSFIVAVTPNSNIGKDQNGIPVFASVLTSFGQFGKTSYLSSMIKKPAAADEAPIVNVYRSDVQDSTTNVKGTWDLLSNQQFTTFITIAENATTTTNGADEMYIKSGAKLIVNVPKQFTVVSVDGFGKFTIPPIVPNSDGSTQIIATLNENVGDGAAGHSNARSIQLTITAPNLTGQTDPKLYVMYVLGDGFATYRTSSGSPLCPSNCADWQIGPLDEVIIKVTP